MRARRPRKRELATFALIVLIAEVAGTSATRRVDGALHVAPLAPSGASYYPFLLVAAKIAGALALAALLARATRAHAAADAGHRLLAAVGHASERRTPRLRPTLSLRVWLASFGATSLLYLVHVDAEGLADGRCRCSHRGWTPTRRRFSPPCPCSPRSPGASPAGCTRSRRTPSERSRAPTACCRRDGARAPRSRGRATTPRPAAASASRSSLVLLRSPRSPRHAQGRGRPDVPAWKEE